MAPYLYLEDIWRRRAEDNRRMEEASTEWVQKFLRFLGFKTEEEREEEERLAYIRKREGIVDPREKQPPEMRREFERTPESQPYDETYIAEEEEKFNKPWRSSINRRMERKHLKQMVQQFPPEWKQQLMNSSPFTSSSHQIEMELHRRGKERDSSGLWQEAEPLPDFEHIIELARKHEKAWRKESEICIFDGGKLTNVTKLTKFACGVYEWEKIEAKNVGTRKNLDEISGFQVANINRRIFISGGKVDQASPPKGISSCFCLDLTLEDQVKFEELSPMLTRRWNHSALAIDGKVYVFGGMNDSPRFLGLIHPYTRLSSIECFDPLVNKWIAKGNLREERTHASGVVLSDSVALVIGGQNYHNSSFHLLNTAERFDSREGKCSRVPSMKEQRSDAAATECNGKIYVTGGVDGNSNACDTTEIYDPIANKWMDGPKMNIRRHGHSLIFDGKSLMTIGGFESTCVFTISNLFNELFNPMANESLDNRMEVLELNVGGKGKWTMHSDKMPFDGRRVRAVLI